MLWMQISLIGSCRSQWGEDAYGVRQFSVLLVTWVFLPYLEFCARVVPELHFDVCVISLVSFESGQLEGTGVQ